MNDEIHVLGLELPVRIGVPEVERASWQVLTADLKLTLRRGFDTMRDELHETVDYERAANEAKALAASRPRLLLEALASELTAHFLADEAVAGVEVLLKKRILPGTDAVAVRMVRRK